MYKTCHGEEKDKKRQKVLEVALEIGAKLEGSRNGSPTSERHNFLSGTLIDKPFTFLEISPRNLYPYGPSILYKAI